MQSFSLDISKVSLRHLRHYLHLQIKLYIKLIINKTF